MELASQLGNDFLPLLDRALMASYRRQQELAWTEHLVEHVENELEAAGALGRPGRVPTMCFLDLTGYTHLTEQQGDVAAAALAETLAVLVNRSAREHDGVPVKWLGDGVMVHHREPAGAVRSALGLVAQLPDAGAGQVLVSGSVAEAAPPGGVVFREAGEVELKGSPIRCGCWRPTGPERLTPRIGRASCRGRV